MKRLLLSLLAVYALHVQAQDTLRLKDVLMHIDLHSQHLQMYDAEARSEEEAAKGARSWMPPELSTGLWMTPYNPKLWKKGDDGMPGMGQYTVAAQQTFPNRKRQNAEAAYMQSMSAVTREKKGAMQNDLYAEAKKNYYSWVVMKKKLSILNENEKLIDFMIKTAEIRYKNGQEKINAYYKARAALGNIHSMRIMLNNEISQKRIMLNTLMHRQRTELFEIDTALNIQYDADITIDSAAIAASRSDVRALDREISSARLQQELERAKLKPEFGIRYEHMFGFGGLPMQYTLMGMVKIPMARWSARMNKASIESLKWKAVSLGQEKEAAMNEVLGMAYSVKSEIEWRSQQLKVYETEIIPALRRNYQTVQLAYEQNTEELFMLYDAWEKLNMTELEYLDQLQQLLIMRAELDKTLEVKE
jgi:outer membrane protein TolC